MLWSNHCEFNSHLGYMSKRFLIESNIALIKEYESNNSPLAEVARRLNVKYDTLKKYLNILGVSYKCECCGLSEWMGKPIPLELHHKDFNHYNNSLDNLQILCANCHMQAHDYCNYKKNKK